MPAESETIELHTYPIKSFLKMFGMRKRSIKRLEFMKRLNSLPQTQKNQFSGIYPHYIGRINGQSMYKASECEHFTSNPFGKRCRKCFAEIQFRDGPSFVTKAGYRIYNVRGKQRLEHVVIGEAVLGRRLKKGECVHHINMIKTDNRKSNLLICTTSYNTWLLKRYAELFAKEHFDA